MKLSLLPKLVEKLVWVPVISFCKIFIPNYGFDAVISEWTNTHQCTNMDGWCTDRILFSIPVSSQVDFFIWPFSALISDFFLELYFVPHPVSFYFLLKVFPPTHYPPLSPTDLFTYIFKLQVDPFPSTYSPIN
jgi:hypothetical protein